LEQRSKELDAATLLLVIDACNPDKHLSGGEAPADEFQGLHNWPMKKACTFSQRQSYQAALETRNWARLLTYAL